MGYDQTNPTIKRTILKLVARGYKEDELEVMFKNDEELVLFYQSLLLSDTTKVKADDVVAVTEEGDIEDSEEPEDDFRLPAEEEARVLGDHNKAEYAANKEAVEKDIKRDANGNLVVSFEELMSAAEDARIKDIDDQMLDQIGADNEDRPLVDFDDKESDDEEESE